MRVWAKITVTCPRIGTRKVRIRIMKRKPRMLGPVVEKHYEYLLDYRGLRLVLSLIAVGLMPGTYYAYYEDGETTIFEKKSGDERGE